MPPLIQVYGIDTSVFVRLLTGHPEKDFIRTAKALKKRVDEQPSSQIAVSNQVIGEAYVTLQHHYGISKPDARKAILDLFRSGNISPLNGRSVMDLLASTGGAGLMDRLIVQDYRDRGAHVLTNDRNMAKLDGVVHLSKV